MPPTIKPSVGESFIEGLRQLNLGEDDTDELQPPDVSVGIHQAEEEPYRDPILQPDCTTPTPSLVESEEHDVRRQSSAESMSVIETDLTSSPARPEKRTLQNRSSSMPEGASGGRIDEAGLDLPNRPRSRSRSRHTATPRGSPDLFTSDFEARLAAIKRKPIPSQSSSYTRADARFGQIYSTEEVRGSEVGIVKGVKDSGQYHSSVPVPSRYRNQLRSRQDEDEGHSEVSRSTVHVDPLRSNRFTYSDFKGGPLPGADESRKSHSSAVTDIWGHDAEDGYRTKELRGKTGKYNGLLRIADETDGLLSPDAQNYDLYGPESRVQIPQPSITDLQQRVDRIKLRLHLPRSITERSLVKASGTDPQGGESQYPVVADEVIASQAQLNPAELPTQSDALNENEAPIEEKLHEGQQARAIDSLSSTNHGHWPLGDIITTTSPVPSTPAPTDASLSPWIPPADWDTSVAQGDFAASSPDFEIPLFTVPHNTPTTEDRIQIKNRKFSGKLQQSRDRIPTPTPGRAFKQSSQATNTDPVKRLFPTRTSSKPSVYQKPHIGEPRSLSPVKESPDKFTAPRESPNPPITRFQPMAQSNLTSSFTQGREDARRSLEAVRPIMPSTEPPPTSITTPARPRSSKKPFSTFRGLFQKKSYESPSVFKLGRKTAPDTSEISSPLLATPTPYRNLQSPTPVEPTQMPTSVQATAMNLPVEASALRASARSTASDLEKALEQAKQAATRAEMAATRAEVAASTAEMHSTAIQETLTVFNRQLETLAGRLQ